MTRASVTRATRRTRKPTGESAPVAIGTRYNDVEAKWDLVLVIGGFDDDTSARAYAARNFDMLPAK